MTLSNIGIFMLGPGKWILSVLLIGIGAMTSACLAYAGLLGLVASLIIELELEHEDDIF